SVEVLVAIRTSVRRAPTACMEIGDGSCVSDGRLAVTDHGHSSALPTAAPHRQPPAAPPPNPGAQAIGGRACSRYALAAPREPGIWPCTVRKGGSLSDIRRRW